MSEKTEQPSEDECKTAEKVMRFCNIGEVHVSDKRLELYPPKSCATCDFCLGPLKGNGFIEKHACMSKAQKDEGSDLVESFLSDDPKTLGCHCFYHRPRQAPALNKPKDRETLREIRELMVAAWGAQITSNVTNAYFRKVLERIDDALKETDAGAKGEDNV